MKKYRVTACLVTLMAISFAFVGFDCSSAELTSAKLYMQRSEWDKAEAQLEKDVKTNPQDKDGWYLLGRVRAEKQDWAGMKDAFAQSLKVDSTYAKEIRDVTDHYWVISYNDGTKYLQAAKDTNSYYEKAVAAFNASIILAPDSTMGYRGLAYTYLNMTESDSAVAPLTVLWNRDKDAESAKFLGEIYYEKGRDLKDQFTNQNGDKLTNLKNVGSIEKGNTEEEVTTAIGQPEQKTTEQPPTEKVKGRKKTTMQEAAKDVWVYKTYGLTLTFRNDTLIDKKVDFTYDPGIDSTNYQAALVQFKKALAILVPASKLYPDDQNILTVMTNCYIASDQVDQASELFKQAAIKNPDNKDFQYDYGVILLRSSDFSDAVDQFQKTLKLDPEYWNAVYNLGATYVNWGVATQDSASANSDPDSLRKVVNAKYALALPYLQKFADHSETDPNIHELLGKVYTALNNSAKAKEEFEKADTLRQTH